MFRGKELNLLVFLMGFREIDADSARVRDNGPLISGFMREQYLSVLVGLANFST